MMKSLLRAIFALTISATGAFAQNEFVTPTQSKTVVGTMAMCFNSSGQAVPWFNAAGTWQCSGSLSTSGGGGSAPSNITPTDCSGTITTGGTAQNAFAASSTIHGFTVANIDAAAGSGEPLWISFTGTASAGAVGSYALSAPAGTSFASMTSFTSPYGFGTNHALSIVAATSSHKFSCTTW